MSEEQILADEQVIERDSLANKQVQGVNLTGMTLGEVSIQDCEFEGVDLAGNQWYSSAVKRVRFTNCGFSNSDFYDTKFEDCQFVECSFAKSEFYGCLFQSCSLVGTNLGWAYCSQVKFTEGSISESVLEGLNLLKSDFHEVKLESNVLTGSVFAKLAPDVRAIFTHSFG